MEEFTGRGWLPHEFGKLPPEKKKQLLAQMLEDNLPDRQDFLDYGYLIGLESRDDDSPQQQGSCKISFAAFKHMLNGHISLNRDVLALIAIAKVQDITGYAIISTKWLSEKIGVGTDSARKSLYSLENAGVITIQRIDKSRIGVTIIGNDFTERGKLKKGYADVRQEIFNCETYRKLSGIAQLMVMWTFIGSAFARYMYEIRKNNPGEDAIPPFITDLSEIRLDMLIKQYYCPSTFKLAKYQLEKAGLLKKYSTPDFLKMHPEIRHGSEKMFQVNNVCCNPIYLTKYYILHPYTYEFSIPYKLTKREHNSETFLHRKHLLDMIFRKAHIQLSEKELTSFAKTLPRAQAQSQKITDEMYANGSALISHDAQSTIELIEGYGLPWQKKKLKRDIHKGRIKIDKDCHTFSKNIEPEECNIEDAAERITTEEYVDKILNMTAIGKLFLSDIRFRGPITDIPATKEPLLYSDRHLPVYARIIISVVLKEYKLSKHLASIAPHLFSAGASNIASNAVHIIFHPFERVLGWINRADAKQTPIPILC